MEKEIVDKLRSIPMDQVYDAYGIDRNKETRYRVRNAIDVLVYQGNMTYQEAVERLYSDINSFEIKEKLIIPQSLNITASVIKRQLNALKAPRYKVFVHNTSRPELNYTSDKDNECGFTVDDILRKITFLSMNNTNGGNIYIMPLYNDDLIMIPVDDISDCIINRFKPNVLLLTSWEKKQGFYVVEKKHERGFYDYITDYLNRQWGDKAVKSTQHTIRLAGFTNRKPVHKRDDVFPFVKIIEVTKEINRGFTLFLEDEYSYYKPSINSSNSSNLNDELYYKQSEIDVNCPLSQGIVSVLNRERNRIIGRFQNIDRSAVDWRISEMMAKDGFSISDAASYLKLYGLHKEPNMNEQERYIRRTVCRAYNKVRAQSVSSGIKVDTEVNMDTEQSENSTNNEIENDNTCDNVMHP